MRVVLKASLVIMPIFALALLISSIQAQQQPVRKVAPDFKLQDTYQDIVALNSYKSKQPVLLFFWTTWCPYCQSELKFLNENYAKLTGEGLEVLAINVGESPERVRRFTRSRYLVCRVPLDKDTGVAKSYGVIGVPTYVLVDRQGNIVFQGNYFPYKQYKSVANKK